MLLQRIAGPVGKWPYDAAKARLAPLMVMWSAGSREGDLFEWFELALSQPLPDDGTEAFVYLAAVLCGTADEKRSAAIAEASGVASSQNPFAVATRLTLGLSTADVPAELMEVARDLLGRTAALLGGRS